MSSVPVGGTIRRACEFAFRGFLGNLGIVWLPVVLIGTLVMFTVPHMLSGISRMLATLSTHRVNPFEIAAGGMIFMRDAVLLGVAALFFRAQMMTGLTERALGRRTGFVPFYLSVGPTFWRVFGAYILVSLLLLAVQIAAGVAIVLLSAVFVATIHGAGAGGTDLGLRMTMGLVYILLRVVLWIVEIYLFIRLTFVLTAVIVAEQRFDLVRAWQLVRGNIVRIFVVGLVIFIPLFVAMMLVYGLVFAADILTLIQSVVHEAAHAGRTPAAIIQQSVDLVRTMLQSRWYLLLPLALIGATLEYGLAAGAGVAGYQALLAKSDDGAA